MGILVKDYRAASRRAQGRDSSGLSGRMELSGFDTGTQRGRGSQREHDHEADFSLRFSLRLTFSASRWFAAYLSEVQAVLSRGDCALADVLLAIPSGGLTVKSFFQAMGEGALRRRDGVRGWPGEGMRAARRCNVRAALHFPGPWRRQRLFPEKIRAPQTLKRFSRKINATRRL